MSQYKLLTINNVLDSFQELIEDWVKAELVVQKLPNYRGWELIIKSFKDTRQGFSEDNIRKMLRCMPNMQKYKNEYQEARAYKKKPKVTKKLLLQNIKKTKSKRELMEFAMPGVNLLSAMGKKN